MSNIDDKKDFKGDFKGDLNNNLNNNCTYIGVCQGDELEENPRCYFLIKSRIPYKALNGNSITHFIAYTSSGKNSQLYNIKYNIYPCFGVMISTHHDDKANEYRLTPILLKTTHYNLKYSRKILNNMYNSNPINESIFLAGSKDTITKQHHFPIGNINVYFGKTIENIYNDQLYDDFFHRMGSNFFLKPIIDNIEFIHKTHDSVISYNNNTEKYYISDINKKKDDITFLNTEYGIYNFYGVDLKNINNYKTIVKEIGVPKFNDFFAYTENLNGQKINFNIYDNTKYRKIATETIEKSPCEFAIVQQVTEQIKRKHSDEQNELNERPSKKQKQGGGYFYYCKYHKYKSKYMELKN